MSDSGNMYTILDYYDTSDARYSLFLLKSLKETKLHQWESQIVEETVKE